MQQPGPWLDTFALWFFSIGTAVLLLGSVFLLGVWASGCTH